MPTREQRDAYLKRTYGLSLDEWEEILSLQGGGCFGCGRAGVSRALHTDHDHKTLLVRGILCVSCNSALRKLKDNPQIASNLAEYLRHPPAMGVIGERKASVRPTSRKRYRKKKATP